MNESTQHHSSDGRKLTMSYVSVVSTVIAAVISLVGLSIAAYQVGMDTSADEKSSLQFELREAREQRDRFENQVSSLQSKVETLNDDLAQALVEIDMLSANLASQEAIEAAEEAESSDLDESSQSGTDDDIDSATAALSESGGRLEVDVASIAKRPCVDGRHDWTLQTVYVRNTPYEMALSCALAYETVAWKQYRVPDGLSRFSARVGLADESRETGELVRFSIWSIEPEAVEITAVEVNSEGLSPIEADLREVESFRIVVEKEEHLAQEASTASSIAVWVEPVLE